MERYGYGCEAFDKVVPAVHLRYSPDKQEKANQVAPPGHYDALIDELYPEVGLSEPEAIFNGTQLKPLNVDHSIREVKVTFMTPSGSAYVFTDE